MSEITIITNNVPRDIIEAWRLTEEEKKKFDYLDWSKIEKGEDSASFFRYKGQLYDLSEFDSTSRYPDEVGVWDGIQSDSYFSGILVKYPEAPDEWDTIIVGRYYS